MVAKTATLALALFGGAEALTIGAAPMRSISRSCNIEMAKKSVGDLTEADLKGKKVLVRCDLNVPLDGKTISDDTRIRASVPTLKYLVENGAKVAVCSHLGRPKEGPEDKFSLGPCATRLGECLGQDVKMAPDCIGAEVASMVDGMSNGDVILLENTRFYKEEEKNVPEFAEKLAAPADLFVKLEHSYDRTHVRAHSLRAIAGGGTWSLPQGCSLSTVAHKLTKHEDARVAKAARARAATRPAHVSTA